MVVHIKKMGTPEDFTLYLLFGIQSWLNNTVLPEIDLILPDASAIIRQAYNDQHEIRWGNVLRGRLASKWAILMNLYIDLQLELKNLKKK